MQGFFETFWLILCFVFAAGLLLWVIENPLKELFQSWRQIIKQDFPDEEVRDLDYTTAKFLLPRLKRLAEISTKEHGIYRSTGWLDDVDDIIKALENVIAANDDPGFSNLPHQKFQTISGLKKLGEMFGDLWA